MTCTYGTRRSLAQSRGRCSVRISCGGLRVSVGVSTGGSALGGSLLVSRLILGWCEWDVALHNDDAISSQGRRRQVTFHVLGVGYLFGWTCALF